MPQNNNQKLTKPKIESCVGCGALVPKKNSPTHEYIGASPGCWELFGELLAKEYEEYNYPPVHRLTVDTYAAQHPGSPSEKSIQSVAIHLMGLHLMLDLHYEAHKATQFLRRATESDQDYHWLEPPESLGSLTILDVQSAENIKEHTDLVHIWAHTVWQAWQPHHEQVRAWTDLFR
ncbi:MAG: DUF5946 family protein [Anaerolineales bacterium]